MILNLFGRLFDLAFSLSLVDVRKGLDVLAGTLLFWTAGLALLGLLLKGLHFSLCLIYLAIY